MMVAEAAEYRTVSTSNRYSSFFRSSPPQLVVNQIFIFPNTKKFSAHIYKMATKTARAHMCGVPCNGSNFIGSCLMFSLFLLVLTLLCISLHACTCMHNTCTECSIVEDSKIWQCA